MIPLDLNYVRAAYPSLKEEVAYFDNAGGTQVLGAVTERIIEYYLTCNVQLGANYKASLQAREWIAAGTACMAQFLNASKEQEVIIGSSNTALVRLMSLSIGKSLQAGDEIIITNADHEANRTPWLALQDQGIVVKTWEFNPQSLQLELKDLDALITEKTAYVAFCHVSNIIGTVHDVKAITKFVHDRGALVFVDGVAAAPHRLPDVQDWDVDFYGCSIYKIFGPHLGILYGKEEHLLRLPGVNHEFIPEDDLPYKFQPGGPNYELTYALTGIGHYLGAIANQHGYPSNSTFRQKAIAAYQLFEQHEQVLTKRLLDYLATKPKVQLVGLDANHLENRVATVSFVVEGVHSSAIEQAVIQHNIGIKIGDFYAGGIVDALGLREQGGVVRVSLAHYNTIEELNRLIGHLDQVLR